MTVKVEDLVPVDGTGPSWEVFEELASFLYDFSQNKFPDTASGPAAIRIIVAFNKLAREGTIESFRAGLRPSRPLHGPPLPTPETDGKLSP